MTASDAPAAEPGATADRAPPWLVFVCDDNDFAVPLAVVCEIVAPQRFTRLPGCGPAVCGLVGLRGRVITVFDLGAALGLRPSVDAADYRLLLIEHGARVVGVVVDAVAASHPLNVQAVVPDEVSRRFGEASGVAVLGGARVVALDTERILGRLLS